MVKRITAIALCCLVVTMSGCAENAKYQRINLDKYTLEDKSEWYIGTDTEVVNTANGNFQEKFPVYKISKRKISRKEFKTMLKQLGIENNGHIKLNENKIEGILPDSEDTPSDYFTLNDEESEKLAWDTFNKLPFIEGTYEYLGTEGTSMLSDSEGEHITKARASFRRTLEDIGITGSDRCDLYFDGSGIAGFDIELYKYKKIDTMEMVPLESASSRIKSPDSFSIEESTQLERLSMIQADKVSVLWCNQYVDGCKILEPMYVFTGTATDVKGAQGEFTSIVIAIPEKYTYKVKPKDVGMVEWMP